MKHPRRRPARRTAVGLAVALALTVTACGEEDDSGSPSTAAPSPATDEAAVSAGADWLSRSLSDGLLAYRTDYGPYTDYGLSIDAALALDAVGRSGEVATVADAVAADLDAYTSGAAFGDKGSTYAGPLAKALVLAQAAGGDPSDFGGQDLVAELEDVTADGGPAAGRIADVSSYGDNANVLGQALTAQALADAGSAEAAAALDHLLLQQCADGGFRLSLGQPGAKEQGCAGATGRAARPDVDATAQTALALQHLVDADEAPAAAQAALDAALDYLRAQQREDGSLSGSGSTKGANANSTGLAGWALGAAGDTEAATAAAEWLRDLQAGQQGCDGWDAGDVGAVGYDQAAVDAAAQDGIAGTARGQWLRATAQALPALAWAPAAGAGLPCATGSE